jgi:hypothetical protein
MWPNFGALPDFTINVKIFNSFQMKTSEFAKINSKEKKVI